MTDRTRRLLLLLIGAGVTLLIVAIGTRLLYAAAFAQQRASLVQTARSQARLIEAMARFQAAHKEPDSGIQVETATLRQLVDAHQSQEGFGQTGEFTLARREGDDIVFLLSQRHQDLEGPAPVRFNSALAEPMRRAVSGLSGTGVGLDYRGVRVLAAYEPVAELGWGIVAKMDLSEIRAPFVKAGVLTGSAALVVVFLATLSFFRLSSPLIAHIEEAEARNRALVESAVDGIITIDERGTIESFNPGAERLFGYAADEVIGKNVGCLMPSPFREEHDSYLASYLRTGVKKIIGIGREVNAQRKDGSTIPVELAISEVRLENRWLFNAIVRDLSERRRAREQLREAQLIARQRERLADVGAITAKIVHDLGNPIAGLSMQSQLILRRMRRGETEKIGEPLERLLATVRRMDSLLREFKDFARDQRLDLNLVQPTEFLGRLTEHWNPEAKARRIELRIEAPPNVPPIRADDEKLLRVFDNLLKNAMDALNQEPGRITLRAETPESGKVRLSVEDTGPGVPDGLDVFRLFETTKQDGTGLGLPVVREIILAHGGTIHHEPVAPHGAIFHIDLDCTGPAVS